MAARRKRLVIWFSLLILMLPVYLQAASIRVSVLTYPSRPRLGEDFQIIIRVNEGQDFSHRVYYTQESFPRALEILGGPYVKPVSNKITDYIYLVKAKEIGLFILPAFFYTNGESTKKTSSGPLKILPRDPNSENYKTKGGYRSPPLSLYQGQAFGLVLETLNLADLMPVDTQNLPPIANTIIENAPGFGSIIEHIFQNRTLYNVPVMAWIIASGHGSSIVLPSMIMKAGNETIASPSVTIDVLPLPQEVKDSGAVGSFTLSSEISETEVIEDSPIQLKLRLEGEGNFHILKLPQLMTSDNFEIVEETENRVLLPSKKGYSGYIEQIYQIKPSIPDSGISFIAVPEFVFWNPESLMLGKTQSTHYTINILSSTQNTSLYSFFSSDTIMLKKDFSVLRLISLWLILLPLLIWKLLVIASRPKEKPVSFFVFLPMLILPFMPYQKIPESLRMADQYVSDKNWDAAQKSFAQAMQDLPHHKAVLMYNQAIAMQRQNQVGWTSYYFMKAIEFDPFEPMYRKAWQLHQKQYKLSSSISLYGFDYSLYIYYFLFVLTFGLILIATVSRKHPKLQKSSFIISILLMGSFIIMLCYQLYNRKSWAVALEDTSLGRIPEKDVSTLYVVREGNVLEIVARFDNFYLLTNEHEGVEGWAKAEKFVLGQDNVK